MNKYTKIGLASLAFYGAMLTGAVIYETQLPLKEQLNRVEYRLRNPVIAVPPFRGAIAIQERISLRKRAKELRDLISRVE